MELKKAFNEGITEDARKKSKVDAVAAKLISDYEVQISKGKAQIAELVAKADALSSQYLGHIYSTTPSLEKASTCRVEATNLREEAEEIKKQVEIWKQELEILFPDRDKD